MCSLGEKREWRPMVEKTGWAPARLVLTCLMFRGVALGEASATRAAKAKPDHGTILIAIAGLRT